MKFLLKPIIALGVILLVLGGIAWKVPANWIVSRTDLAKHEIKYARSSGTLWNGKAEKVEWRKLLMGDIQWSFMTLNRVSPLYTTWQLKGQGLDYQLSLLADVERTSLRRLRFINGELPAGWVDLSKAIPLLFLGGQLNVNLDFLEFNWGPQGLATGSIQWKDAAFTGLFEENLGDITINIEWADGDTRVYFQSTQVRDIMIEGEASLTARRYDVLLVLHTSENKRYVIEKLAHLGETHPDGSLHISLFGSMRR